LSVDSSDVARLFRKHSPLVYARALRLLGSRSEAEEVTQDAFVRLLTTTSNAPAGNQTVPWLCTLTTNLCLNRLRDHERHDLLHATVLQHTQDAEPAQQPVLVQMRRLLARADEKLARAAVYVLVDGMTHEEAAEYLEVSPRTVGNFIDRFKEWALRDMEGADGGLSGEES
jgi:RNA polymerase sigma-70 factor (ECF subfamily)